ncbi:MAG TPA: hypothetical protein VNT54_00215 [Solirubrobacteraceae bacterium]|nr:hypothetical protein [Solirubrobacteraceae bacterium]
MPDGGAYNIVENLDDARRENAFGLMMSLNMLIEFGDAFDFTRRTSRKPTHSVACHADQRSA